MDQIKIGEFLKKLRKEKNLTQEQVAEHFYVSNRTVSRWETGSNMPDISTLIEIAEFYDVSIPEIINGERKNENLEPEIKETAEKMAEYSHNEVKISKLKIAALLLIVFGSFIIISALSIFPAESSWSGVYSVFGSMILIVGIFIYTLSAFRKKLYRILAVIFSVIILFGMLNLFDYIAVSSFNQVPRFRYETYYTSQFPDQLLYRTLFFDAVRKDPGSENETVTIIDR